MRDGESRRRCWAPAMANTVSAVRLRLKPLPTSRHRKTLSRAREAVGLAMSKHNFERVSPEIAQDSEAMLKARKEVERGWPRAMEKIAERASLTKGPDTRRNPPRGVYS